MGEIVYLWTGYEREVPVRRVVLVRELGVHPKTVDRWVSRDGMPEDTLDQRGCWMQVGAQRRFFVSRVRGWLSQRGTIAS